MHGTRSKIAFLINVVRVHDYEDYEVPHLLARPSNAFDQEQLRG